MSVSRHRFRSRLFLGGSALLLVFVAMPAAALESPWFLEVKFGAASVDADFGRVHRKFFDDEADASSIEVGYSINRFLGIQLGYHDAGESIGTGAPCADDEEICVDTLVAAVLGADVSAWSLAATPRWPVNEKFALRGRLGVVTWDSTISGLLTTRPTEDFSGEDLMVGVGGEYVLRSGLGFVLEFSDYDPGVATTSLGFSWRF